MKATKRILLCLLLFVCSCVPGEMYQYYLNICNQFLSTDLHMQPEISLEQMLTDIQTEAIRHGVQVFKLSRTSDSAFREKLTLYADAEARRILEERYALKEGSFSGMFSGMTEIQYVPFSSVSEELLQDDPDFQLLGTPEDAHAFKKSLINRYGGGFPAENNYDPIKQTSGMITAVWILLILAAALLTLYDVLLLKKEHFVRITMGERIRGICLRYMLSDLLFFSLAFACFSGFAYAFYGIAFRFSLTVGLFLVFCAVNTIAALPILMIAPKTALANDFSSGKVLTFSYAVKICTIIMGALLTASCGDEITECLRFYRQKPVYDQYAEYRRASRMKENESDIPRHELQDALYKRYDKDVDIIYDYQCMAFGEDDAETAIVMNRNAMPLLLCSIPELAQTDFDSDLYIILPEGKVLREEDRNTFEGKADKVRILTYSQHAEVFTFPADNSRRTSQAVSELAENPVILFHYTDQAEEGIRNAVSFHQCFMKPSEEMDAFIREAGYTCVWTSMSELFAHHWKILRRTLYLNAAVCVMLLILQILLLGCILRLEYSVHAQENAVKKILGYTVFQKFRKPLLTSLLLYIACGAAAVKLSGRIHTGSVPLVCAAVLLTCTVDFVFFLLLIRHYEKSSIPRTLKGGAL